LSSTARHQQRSALLADGRSIAFISTNGKVDIWRRAARGHPAQGGGAPRIYPMDDAWVNEHVVADSASIYLQANDGTSARRERMFRGSCAVRSRTAAPA
jgi:hypothetical protein